MKSEEERIRQILKRGIQEPAPGFSARVMQEINGVQKSQQALALPHAQTSGQEWSVETPTMGSALKPLAGAFGLVALLAIIVSLLLESDFSFLKEKMMLTFSVQQMTNLIFSLIAFWVLMLLSPWIKKRVYHFSGE